MKPPRFAYHDPPTIDGALALLAQHRDAARILAGGQSLMPMLNFRLARPDHLIDINRIAELAALQPSADGGVRIGAMVRQRTLERSPLIRERCPLITRPCPSSATRRSPRAVRSSAVSTMRIQRLSFR